MRCQMHWLKLFGAAAQVLSQDCFLCQLRRRRELLGEEEEEEKEGEEGEEGEEEEEEEEAKKNPKLRCCRCFDQVCRR